MLTRKQHQLLMFIDERLSETGISPSFDEMKEALGLKSKSGIHRLITGLEERGFIRRLPHRARALEVTCRPANNDMATLYDAALAVCAQAEYCGLYPGKRLVPAEDVQTLLDALFPNRGVSTAREAKQA